MNGAALRICGGIFIRKEEMHDKQENTEGFKHKQPACMLWSASRSSCTREWVHGAYNQGDGGYAVPVNDTFQFADGRQEYGTAVARGQKQGARL
jgi:hypothetical protein